MRRDLNGQNGRKNEIDQFLNKSQDGTDGKKSQSAKKR